MLSFKEKQVASYANSKIAGLEVCYRNRNDLKISNAQSQYPQPEAGRAVARAIKDFGWTVPLIVDEDDVILAGHGRLLAAAKLGIDEVPTIRLGHMSPAQKKSYVIADNRLSEIAGSWDKKLLALEHEAIQLLDPGFDLTSTGFEDEEIEIMLDGLKPAGEEVGFEVDLSRPATSQPSDLWLLGRHRLYCGNALEEASFRALLGDEKAQPVIVDAPYNVRVGGHCVGKGRHAEFVMASGEMSRPEFAAFLTNAFQNLITFSQDGSIHFLFMDWRHMAEMVLATSQYGDPKNLVVWDKQQPGLGSFLRSQHELVWVMKNGTAKHINNCFGKHGRDRSNVWSYPGLSGGGAPNRLELLALHPTIKPKSLIEDAIKDCSRKDGLVLDCFAGSGTIILAAEATGRRSAAIELDPKYVDVAVGRWQRDTGQKATLGHDGRSFDQIEKDGR